MTPMIQLIIHNVSSIFSAVIAVGLSLFIFLNGKRETANITFALVFFATAIFYVSHVIGVNVVDPVLSRNILMWNMVIMFVVSFNLHAVLASVGKEKERIFIIYTAYIVSVLSVIFFIWNPDLFLLPSVPKMYFPNYYNPGVLNWFRLVYINILIVPYCIFELYRAYRGTDVPSRRKQLKYFILTMLVGYGTGLLPNFLIYNVQFDPIWGILFVVLCSAPLIYGALKYELFNVQVIAKQAFLYSLAVGGVGGFITLLNYSSTWIATIYPGFPTWTIALVSAVLAVTLAVIIWKQLRESDLMKAEFITTVTHKFRTPLTYIKWATDNLLVPDMSLEDRKAQVEYIRTANEKLVELTNILTSTSDAENKGYEFKLKRGNVSALVEEVITSLEHHKKIKNLTIEKNIEPNLFAKYDEERLRFVVQVLFENALHYNKQNGLVTVTLSTTRKDIVFSVKDQGVGLSPTQLSLLFTKFFRTHTSRELDTEGMGIGLYISKSIMDKLEGKIWATSEGEMRGSIFFISLPRVK